MVDYFDFFAIKDDDFFSGTYYARRPKTTQDVGIEFAYDIEDAQQDSRENVLSTLQTKRELFSIRTVEPIKFKIQGYVVTQEGEFWQIDSLLKRPYKQNKEVYRLFKNAPTVETVLRLVKVENPWQLK